MTSLWCLLLFSICSVLQQISFNEQYWGMVFEHIHLPQVLSFYKTYLHPWVITTEAWFIGFLITEFLSVGAFLLFINTINVGSSFHLFTGMKF